MYKRSDRVLNQDTNIEIQKFGNHIAKLVHSCFDSELPNKKGKPQLGREWTVIAAVVIENYSGKVNCIEGEVSILADFAMPQHYCV